MVVGSSYRTSSLPPPTVVTLTERAAALKENKQNEDESGNQQAPRELLRNSTGDLRGQHGVRFQRKNKDSFDWNTRGVAHPDESHPRWIHHKVGFVTLSTTGGNSLQQEPFSKKESGGCTVIGFSCSRSCVIAQEANPRRDKKDRWRVWSTPGLLSYNPRWDDGENGGGG